MNIKKVISLIIVATLAGSTLTACSQSNKPVNDIKTVASEKLSTTAKNEKTTAAHAEESSSAAESTTASDAKTTAKSSTSAKADKATTKKSSKNSKTSTTKSSGKKNNAATTKRSNTATTAKPVSTTKPATTAPAPTAININLTKNGNAQCSSSNVTVDAPNGLETQGIVYIEKGGEYVITSSTDTWHGQIVIKLANTESANIRFENVNITTTKANAIKILDTNITAERTFIEADAPSNSTGDTDNALRDEMKQVAKQQKAPNVDLSFPTGTASSFQTSSNSLSGAIYNESKLTIKGNGNVNITTTTNRNNTICSTKSVTFKNVNATLTTPGYGSTASLSSARGIFTFSKVYVESGKLTIHSNGDGIRCEEFNSSGGTTTINSSACDGIDADDTISISGGTVKSTALEKSAFKVRRVNNQEALSKGDKTIKPDDGIVKANHTFKIDGGTVIGEGKNMTSPKKRAQIQSLSSQPAIYCKSTKSATSEVAKISLSYTIKHGSTAIASSSAECIKFLYSSPNINTKDSYTVSGKYKGSTYKADIVFTGLLGDAKVIAN